MPLLTINSKSCNRSTQEFMSTARKNQKKYALLLQLLLHLKKKITQRLQLKHLETPKQNSNSNAHQSRAISFGRIATLKELLDD